MQHKDLNLIFVVPAHAGVIPRKHMHTMFILCGPRTCGGDPVDDAMISLNPEWSPHMRG